jgi:hypothetical protein
MRNRFLCKGKHAGEPFGSILPTTDVAHEHPRTRCPHAWEGDVHLAKQVPVRISRGLQTWIWKNLQATNDGRWSRGRLFQHMILFRPWKSCVADFRALDGLHRIGALLMVCMLAHVFKELPMHYYRKSISTFFCEPMLRLLLVHAWFVIHI